jgi:uncharacterized protein YhjY with autotransporter beta-barrel domain
VGPLGRLKWGHFMTIQSKTFAVRSRYLGGAAALAILAAGLSTPAQALVTPEGTTPAAAVDNANSRPYWVGLGIRNEAGNGGGTCTGLLINPRTVLFAAHCVDGLAPAAYDGNAPGNRAQVGYTTDPTFGRTNLREWLFGQDFVVPPGDARVMNASSVMVWYDPRSRFGSAPNPARAGTFLPADVAIAAFDTPNELLGRDAAGGIGLLLSQVNSLVPVVMGGYGQSGNGQTGTRTATLTPTAEENFFRRLGNNQLGFLGDERSIALGIYPPATADGLEPPPDSNYQDLYWADFDDPNRATRPFFNGPGGDTLCVSTNLNCRLDHDPFPGAAVAGEAITAAGDSGSPLVTNAFGREVSLGVLSQGSRFFYESLGTPDDNFVRFTGFSNYGTTAGYNPLFLFWDQLVVNNPYKYVTAAAGDGEWTNPARWTQEIDPLYMTLSGGTLVNALPTTPALGSSSAAPNVGTINPNPSPLATCAVFGTCPPTGGTSEPMPDTVALPGEEAMPGQVAMPGRVALPGVETLNDFEGLVSGNPAQQANSGGEGPIGEPSEPLTTALWSSGTLIGVQTGALTGPGTTGFTPDNTNGTPGLQNSTRFFEVNLRSAGTTFLTGTTVTIDRLNVRGATSGLNIRSGAQLNTTISSFVDNGTLTVNGTFAPRQLMILGGKVMGTGVINATGGVGNVGGRIAPGNSIGPLTFNGNLVQSAAGVFEVEVTNGSADLLTVNGAANLAGTIDVRTFGANPLKGQSFTVLTASDGRTGTFSTVLDNITGLLFPTVSYTANTVVVSISSQTFCQAAPNAQNCSFLDGLDGATTPAMQAQIQALQNMDAATVAVALASINPSRTNAQTSAGFLFTDLIKMQLGHRSSDLLSPTMGGMSSAMMRASTQVASSGASADVVASAALAAMQTSVPGAYNSTGWSLFASGDFGTADTQNIGGIDEAAAQAFTAGADYSAGDGVIVGGAISALNGEVDQNYGLGGKTKADGYAGSLYAGFANATAAVDLFMSYGMTEYETTRTVMPAPLTFVTASGETEGSLFQVGGTVNLPLNFAKMTANHFALSLVGGAHYASQSIDGYTETGAGGWSVIYADRDHESFKAQAGFELSRAFKMGTGTLTPFVRVQGNSEMSGGGLAFTGSFVAAPTSSFTTMSPDLGSFWGSVALGATAQVGEDSAIYVRYQNEFSREGQEADQVSLAARFGF